MKTDALRQPQQITLESSTIRYISFALTIIIAVVSATIFISARPDREEVRQMIDEKVNSRMDRIEVQLDEVQKDIKTLLRKDKND